MDSDRVRELWDCLSDVDFRTRSRNPDWFKSVVVSMLLGPGNQDAIEERAIEVVRALGLAGITFRKVAVRGSIHPSTSATTVRELITKTMGTGWVRITASTILACTALPMTDHGAGTELSAVRVRRVAGMGCTGSNACGGE